jgi:hypothetical protein
MAMGLARTCMRISEQSIRPRKIGANQVLAPELLEKRKYDRMRNDIRRWQAQIKTNLYFLCLFFVPLMLLGISAVFACIIESQIDIELLTMSTVIVCFVSYAIYVNIQSVYALRHRIDKYDQEMNRFNLSQVNITRIR